MFLPFDRKEREALLQRRLTASRMYNELMDESAQYAPWSQQEQETLKAAEHHLRVLQRTENEYFGRLPRLTLSCCPFDGKPLVRTFDPYGLDGPWWRSDATPDEIPSCPHFCILLGAVDLNGQPPHGGDFDAHPGPDVPYVVPRLLEHEEMVAVISQLEMENGYIAYPIAYFARKRPPPEALTAGWARTNFVYTTQFSEEGWRIRNDPWDFDLAPWLEAGKIRWCPPGSDNGALSAEGAGNCPFVDLPGQRRNLIVRGGDAWPAPLPDGETIVPFEAVRT